MILSEIPNSKDERYFVCNEANNANFPNKNKVNTKTVCLLTLIEVLVSQGSFLII